VGKGRLEERCGLDWGRIGLGADWFGVRIGLGRIGLGCGLDLNGVRIGLGCGLVWGAD